MVQRKSGRPVGSKAFRQRDRKLSKRQRAIYRRRRIVVGIVLVVTLALVSFCIYSLGRGLGALGDALGHGERVALSRSVVPDPIKTNDITDCSSSNVELSLTPASQSVAVGGSLDFTATITYTGSSKAGCLIDGSDSSRVLTISSGKQTIWRSDVCESDSRMLLMAKGDSDKYTITWNADSTGTQCVADSELPRVNAGTYTAQLSLKDFPKTVSDPVTITVQ
ncbi:hypothetical protein KIH79_01340 [Bifidobacterium sp. 82T10]|uniref:Uncharacterized protein n=1 Tax=Bifidobacterium miconis TaxID=2834435 RepID=A0ABS6WCN7_9BIFI|nr:hypothetical protein [Bifidobacterium miconis]MBW3091617.1 hypothetical protein [Bifidobacterium miconis]